MATCDVPKEYVNKVPEAMSIQSTGNCNEMEASPGNVLKVIYNKRSTQVAGVKTENMTEKKKPSIGICVQAFRFGMVFE